MTSLISPELPSVKIQFPLMGHPALSKRRGQTCRDLNEGPKQGEQTHPQTTVAQGQGNGRPEGAGVRRGVVLGQLRDGADLSGGGGQGGPKAQAADRSSHQKGLSLICELGGGALVQNRGWGWVGMAGQRQERSLRALDRGETGRVGWGPSVLSFVPGRGRHGHVGPTSGSEGSKAPRL